MDRKKAPLIHNAIDFKYSLKHPEVIKLDNGVPVYTIHSNASDVLALELVFFAGNWYEEQNAVAAATNFLIKNGTSKKSAYEINEDIEFYGAYFNRACYNETATVSLHCLSRYADELIPLIKEVITDANYPEEELEIYKQNQKQRLKVNLLKCDFVANRLIDEYLFGRMHPYGKYNIESDYDNLTRNQLIEFYNQYYINGNCIIFAAGNLPADFAYHLNNAFGALPLNKKTLHAENHPVHPAKQKKHREVIDPNGVQGAIRIARDFPNRHHPDFIPVQILNTLYGGFFGSRLMTNIREDKGFTYGIHSYIQNHINQCAWLISTEAGREVCEATIHEVYHEMERLKQQQIPVEELHLVKNFMLGSILGDLDGPFQIIGRWKNYVLNNLDESYFERTIQTIKNISAEELKSLANKYLNPDDFYELLVI